MSEEREPTLRDVLHAVQGVEAKVHANGASLLELGGEVGEVRIGSGRRARAAGPAWRPVRCAHRRSW